MIVSINGLEKEVSSDTVGGLLTELGFRSAGIAVEKNKVIVPKSLHATEVLKEGDTIEIVHCVAGG